MIQALIRIDTRNRGSSPSLVSLSQDSLYRAEMSTLGSEESVY